ncbi:MAG: glycosyltransferase [Candidatus Cloacimonetes bacterium]|nr:glycosyltransferase [Candidatus Cloacimonadota bacterium]
MKILYLTLKASNAHFVKWAGAALEAGHEIQVLHSFPDTPVLPVPTHFVDGNSTLFDRSVGRLRHVLRCRQLIRQFKPDIVHVHFMDPNLTVLGWSAFPRTVVSIWGSDLILPRMPLNEILRRHGMRSAWQLTATNRLLAYAARAHLPMTQPIEVIPFGVDTTRFAPGPRQSDGRFRVGCVKHFETIYGLEHLVRAVASLRSRIPDIELVLAGEGSLKSSIQSLVKELGLDDCTHFPGSLNNDRVPELLRSLDVFAMPSLYESFGVSALEASACGLPVVSSDAGGIPDVVQHERTGILVNPADSGALAQALLDLHANPALRRTLGDNGRRFVQDRFEWTDCAARMEAVYARRHASAPSGSHSASGQHAVTSHA